MLMRLRSLILRRFPRDHEKHLRVFRREERGLAAVEFALILPVMITMFFGMAELSLAIFARTDTGQVASTVSDLVAQKSSLASADVTTVYNAANTLLYPYYPNMDSNPPSIRISSVIYDTVGKSTSVGKVAWSCVQAGNAAFPSTGDKAVRSTNSSFDLKKNLLSSGSSVIVAEVPYTYKSTSLKYVVPQFVMSDQFITKPRRVAVIPVPTCP